MSGSSRAARMVAAALSLAALRAHAEGVVCADPQLSEAAWNQLEAELTGVRTQLAVKMAEAEAAGHTTAYARVSQVVLDRFTTWSQHDRANPDVLAAAVDAVWWDEIVPADYHLTLPFNQAQDAIDVGNRAIQELQAQIDGRVTLAPPVDFSTGGMTQGQRNWLKDGKPVFPSGINFMPNDPGVLEAFGRKGGWYYALSELRENGTVFPWAFEGDIDSVNSGLANNQNPVVSFFGSQVRSWMTDQHPDIQDGRRNFIRWDIDHPEIRGWVQQYLEDSFPEVLEAVGDNPRVHLLANEPHFGLRQGSWAVEYGISEHTKDKYGDWLKARYGNDLAALNTAHGAGYGSFEQAGDALPFDTSGPNPKQWGVPLSLRGGPVWYDVMRFNMDRVNAWFTFNAQAVHSVDPNGPTTLKIRGHDLTDRYRDGGMDIEYLAKLQGVLGSDFEVTPAGHSHPGGTVHEWEDRYAMGWREQTMGLDFYRSIAPDKPFYDSEWHGFSARWRHFEMDEDYVRSALWLGFTNGLGMVEAWVWGRENDGSPKSNTSFVGDLTTQPNALDAYGRVIKEVNAHAEAVASLAPTERQFMICYVEDSAIQDEEYWEDLGDVYEALRVLNLPVGFTTPSEIANLVAGQTVIVPRTPYISDASLAPLQAFAGDVVLVDPAASLALTEHGVARAASGISPVATIALADPLAMADSLRMALAPMVVEPPISITITDAADQPAYGVLMNQSLDPATGEVTFSLINVSKDPRQVTIEFQGDENPVWDLLKGREAATTLTLQPYDVHLLKASVANATGDFNGDGVVDAADFTVWRDNLGASDESLIGFAGVIDGVIDVNDYLAWRSSFSSQAAVTASSTDAAATPSPGSLALAVAAGGLLLSRVVRQPEARAAK